MFVKNYLSTILMTTACLALSIFFFMRQEWLWLIVWVVVTVINLYRLALGYKKMAMTSKD